MTPLLYNDDNEDDEQHQSELDVNMNGDEGDEEADDNDPLADLPPYVLNRLDKLKEIEEERKSIAERYVQERAALEKRFADMQLPLNERRREIVTGEKDAELDDVDVPVTGRLIGVPDFWYGAMSRIEAVGDMIFEDDVPCLEYLRDITCADDEDGKGFTLKFHFEENEYFYDSVLTKSYRVPNLLVSDEPLLQSVSGCSINWKIDACLTKHMVEKKQRGMGKNSGKVRTVKKEEQKDSFFNWFDPPQMPEDPEELDEEQVEEIEAVMEQDFEAALTFRTHLVPHATAWFTGKAIDEELDEAFGEEG